MFSILLTLGASIDSSYIERTFWQNGRHATSSITIRVYSFCDYSFQHERQNFSTILPTSTLTIHICTTQHIRIDTEAVLDPLVGELLEAGEGAAALDLVSDDMVDLLSQAFEYNFEEGTIAGLGVNGGDPLPFQEWMNALVDQEVAALPESDPAINSIVRELLVSCRFDATYHLYGTFLSFLLWR